MMNDPAAVSLPPPVPAIAGATDQASIIMLRLRRCAIWHTLLRPQSRRAAQSLGRHGTRRLGNRGSGATLSAPISVLLSLSPPLGPNLRGLVGGVVFEQPAQLVLEALQLDVERPFVPGGRLTAIVPPAAATLHFRQLFPRHLGEAPKLTLLGQCHGSFQAGDACVDLVPGHRGSSLCGLVAARLIAPSHHI